MPAPSPIEFPSVHDKAVAFTIDARGVPVGSFAAEKIARLTPDRDFDILICSCDDITLPQPLQDLGIKTVKLDIRQSLERENFKLKRFPVEAYANIYLPTLLGDTYRRILFLDYDTYATTSELSRFLDLDLGGHALAGVRDVQQWDRIHKNVLEFKKHGLPGLKYLNTGMMLFDTAACNNAGMLDRMLAANRDYPEKIQNDQSVINLGLRGVWAEVSPVWNWQWTRSFPFFTHTVAPRILHFQSESKPFRGNERQAVYSPVIVNEYALFLREHFPEAAFEVLPHEAFRRPFGLIFIDGLHHAYQVPRLRRLFRRFENDWHVLT